MPAINKRFAGSDLSAILVAAVVLVGGSVYQVLHGEHYKHALRAHCLLREALNVCALQQSNFQLNNIECAPGHARPTLKENHDELLDLLADEKNIMFQDIANANSDMADIWLSYCKMVDIVRWWIL